MSAQPTAPIDTAPIDLVLLTNGPGELSTWVRPVLKALRARLGNHRDQVRISVVISPCVNANGQEQAVAQSYPEVDRVLGAANFMPFLLWGKTPEAWDWRAQGVVIFLGGEQFYTVAIGKRLGYGTVSYIEWEARWLRWVDRFGVRQANIHAQITQAYPAELAHKCRIVGDLMADTQVLDQGDEDLPPPDTLLGMVAKPEQPAAIQRILLMPGSKPGKLRQCVPLMLAVAERIQPHFPTAQFVLPVAPKLSLGELASYADATQNSAIPLMGGVTAKLEEKEGSPYLQTQQGLRVDLWTQNPAYDLLRQSQFCLTTIGANTAELASLAIPMVVLLPMQELWQDWDGLPGLLTRLPGIGKRVGNATFWLLIQKQLGWQTWRQIWANDQVNWDLVKQGLGLRAWPNLWARQEIVPELVGILQPEPVTEVVLGLLQHPTALAEMRQRLQQVRGAPGAAVNLVELVVELLTERLA
jgi:hypothetical protein